MSQNGWGNGKNRKLSAHITEGKKHAHDFSPSSVVPKSILQKNNMEGKLISSLACPVSSYVAVFPNRKNEAEIFTYGVHLGLISPGTGKKLGSKPTSCNFQIGLFCRFMVQCIFFRLNALSFKGY